ncbi:MAG: hypothetical protein A2301_01335 [Candidatus Magasanikbacteria bacterium RIFOXYB2_FULL_40_13]|uniref:J domain-containing protein n=2 Tax=Candidatus Magasanikiibacteriota TaxID=1752731 RepID=A0A1F6NFU6_9BACT|nr:MAG: hypothetical protein A2373_00590 [Candidatus Magasanikbacteria bacterium RIFOXYB1_FULL_40_15]OGH86588.1 MAG: hypothetical protein A2301_01335 [Candidatus Magasanikbacteria bacterium RIFOXYB2_FULL_40_13]OGH87228.1 MAG: hypothetical protein A2206_00845 [Candidatus Magasanikbacteria bacterium RIFOXYA1_FULL_40_8]
MNKQEALKLLGVKEGVNKEELKVAFNKKAHKLHPDKKGGTSEDFIKLKEACEVLLGKTVALTVFGNGPESFIKTGTTSRIDNRIVEFTKGDLSDVLEEVEESTKFNVGVVVVLSLGIVTLIGAALTAMQLQDKWPFWSPVLTATFGFFALTLLVYLIYIWRKHKNSKVQNRKQIIKDFFPN